MNLDTKKPVGNGITAPEAASYDASKSMDVSLKNDMGINPGASSENLSKKFKTPAVHQDVPAAGQNQYE